MSNLRQAAQQALEALLTYEQYIQPLTDYFGGPRVPEEGSASAKVDAAITALKAALAEPVQEPVAWFHTDFGSLELSRVQRVGWKPLYAAPPQRKPLTEEEIWRTYKNLWMFHPAEEPRLAGDVLKFARAIERVHGIGEQQ